MVSPSEFTQKALLAAHARGLILREVSYKTYALAVRNSEGVLQNKIATAPTEKARKNLEYALHVKRVLTRAREDGLCRIPLTQNFVNVSLMGPDGWRTDNIVIFAFTLNATGTGFNLVGISMWGTGELETSEGEPFKFVGVGNPLNDIVKEKRVAEIDILCVREGSPRGVGSILFAYTLARIASRKKQGQQRFQGVMTRLAVDDNNKAPLGNIVRRYGFNFPNIRRINNGRVDTRSHFATTWGNDWVTRAYNALPEMDANMRVLCPLVARSGKSYCR